MPNLILPPDLIPAGKTFCNTPPQELALATEQLSQWPVGTEITFGIGALVPGFSKQQMIDLGVEAYREWHEKSGLPPVRYTANNNDAKIIVMTRAIDGKYGVLAEAELPAGNITSDRQLRMWFDLRDTWSDSMNPPSGRIPILPVWKHEAGHSFGLGHNMDGIKNALMDPTLSDITTLQLWDIQQIQVRYGKPEMSPPSTPTTQPPSPGNRVDQFGDTLERFGKWIRQSPQRDILNTFFGS